MILMIDNYDSFTYNLYQAIAPFVDVIIKRNDEVTLDEIEALNPSGILLSPGPGRPEEAGISIEVIKRFGGKIPILGVCLGHQAIAIAYGGKVGQSPQIFHGKESLIFHMRKGLFQKMPLPFTAGRYHSLIVEKIDLPSDLDIVAETEKGLIMAIQHKKYPVFGIQFHPESILTPEGVILLKNFLERCT